MRQVILLFLVLLAAAGVVVYLVYIRKSRDVIKARGRRALDKAARIERPDGPATIDFRQVFWGHNISVTVDGEQIAHGHFWVQERVYAGDYILWTARDHSERRYRLTWIRAVGDPTDMFEFEAVPAPEYSRG